MSSVLPNALQLHGEEGYLEYENNHPYLFRCRHVPGLFHDFEHEMVELNDFCFLIQESLKHYSYQPNLEIDTNPANFDTREEFDQAQYEAGVLYSADYNPALVGEFYFPASTITLLYFQIISFLRSIAKILNGGDFKARSNATKDKLSLKNGGKTPPEIDVLVEMIDSGLGVKTHVFDIPEIEKLVRNKLRQVRNDYAHGDWVALKSTLKGVNLAKAFWAVSRMLELLDELYEEWERNQQDPEALQAFLENGSD